MDTDVDVYISNSIYLVALALTGIADPQDMTDDESCEFDEVLTDLNDSFGMVEHITDDEVRRFEADLTAAIRPPQQASPERLRQIEAAKAAILDVTDLIRGNWEECPPSTP